VAGLVVALGVVVAWGVVVVLGVVAGGATAAARDVADEAGGAAAAD
jgi:hypothetical protein